MTNLSALKNSFCKHNRSSLRIAGTLLLFVALSSSWAFGQSARQIQKAQPWQFQAFENARILPGEEPMQAVYKTAPGSNVPVGAIQEGVVTTVKVGEASNVFGTLSEGNNPVSVLNGYGTSGAGIVAFAHRHNINTCGGVGFDNGRVRYAISSDGGTNWNVGGGVTTSPGVGAPTNHCYGVLELNATYTQRGRYPMSALMDVGGTGTDASVALVYVGASRGDDNPRVWDGSTNSLVTGAATATPTKVQEDYLFSTEINSIPYGLVTRVPGEFWYVSSDPDIDLISAFKGVYNSTTNQVDWTVGHQFTPNLFTGFDGNSRFIEPQISFSPDGMTGYIAFLGDLVGGQDTTYQPVFLESTDGGATWGAPEEFDMSQFPALVDSLQQIAFLDSISPTVFDTVFLTGKATTGFSGDLTVDANGNPHFIAIVGGTSTTSSLGLSATADPEAGYSIFSGYHLAIYDFTKDSFGDWNMLYVSTQNVFRGFFGDFADPDDPITVDPHMQIGRSDDGEKVFFAWTDTDTTGNYTPIADPNGGNGNSNHSPDLRVRSFDALNYQMSPRQIPTLGDPNWDGRILLPKLSHISLDTGSVHKLPVVFADLDAGAALSTTSYYYMTDVAIDDADYTEQARFFYNCKQNPMSNSINVLNPGCGQNDGALSVSISGGDAPYSILWNTGSTNDTISSLAPGIYSVTVTDSLNCATELNFTLNSANAPTLTIGGLADISCFGAGDGTATVTPSGGAGGETYTWSNGESAATATMLPPGITTVEVNDSNGCTAIEQVTINEPDAIAVETSSTGVDCAGDANGTATALATGGTGTLSFSWDNGAQGGTIIGLSGGTYTVTVTDENACTADQFIVVDEPAPITVIGSSSPNIGSLAAPTGFASVSPSGGSNPYTYSWYGANLSGSDDQSFISNQCEGWYYVDITDANNCTVTDSVEIAVGAGATGCFTDNIEDELKAGITTMQLIPNPNNGSFNLRLELDRPEDLQIEVINTNGQVVAREELNRVSVHNQAFQLQGVASGIYLIKVTTTRGAATQKMVIQ
jgi:hypothetical protein